MFGWLREAAACASSRNRARKSGSLPELRAQQLDRHVAIELGVARPVDRGHAALPKELDQAIAAAEDAPDLGHGLLVSLSCARPAPRPGASYRTGSDRRRAQMSSVRRYSRNSLPMSGRASASSTDAWSQPIVVPAS